MQSIKQNRYIMDIRLIKLFKAALKDDSNATPVDPMKVNAIAIRAGYIIPKELCNNCTMDFVMGLKTNYNSTFYKCWDQIERMNETSILVDQLMHYASTYGTDFSAPTFTKNDNYVEIPYSEYTILKSITKEELFEKCTNMIKPSLALSSDTVITLCTYIAEYVNDNNIEFDVDVIENKEAQAVLCHYLDKFPTSDPYALLRCLVYSSTGSTMLIKDQVTINSIASRGMDLSILSSSQKELLSTIFYRFKPIFLAFKKYGENNPTIINQIRRMAEKNHKPFRAGFWETVLSRKDYNVVGEAANRLDELTNFKLIQLIQAIRERLLATNIDAPNMYKIRNGKFWLKENEQPMMHNKIYCWETMLELFIGQLIKNLKKKACTVKFPENLVLTCPSSEKNFVGNIPFGSYFNMTDKNYIGIYWRNEWGTRDFDLSAIDIKGCKVGWNAMHKNEGLIYSGDMTNADPEAAEIIQCKKYCEDSILFVNRYSGVPGSKFELMFGQSDRYTSIQQDAVYMMNPDYIKIKEEMKSESTQQMVGMILNNKMYMMDLKFGDYTVSSLGDKTLENLFKSAKRKMLCYMDLKQLLLAAGFKERKRDTVANPIELDLTNLNKDTLINLFS